MRVQHGRPDHEPVLVATVAGGEVWRYLRANDGAEFELWKKAYRSKTKILEDRWVVIELNTDGIKEYGAYWQSRTGHLG